MFQIFKRCCRCFKSSRGSCKVLKPHNLTFKTHSPKKILKIQFNPTCGTLMVAKMLILQLMLIECSTSSHLTLLQFLSLSHCRQGDPQTWVKLLSRSGILQTGSILKNTYQLKISMRRAWGNTGMQWFSSSL